MTQWPARLVLVGAGKMGGAMAQGWLDAGLAASSLTILEPKPSPEIASLAASRGIALNPRIAAPPEVLVLATKPQSLDQVAPGIAAIASAHTLVLSILAGKTIANLDGAAAAGAGRRAGDAQPSGGDRQGRHRAPSPTRMSLASSAAGASACSAPSGRSTGLTTRARSTR